MNDTHEAMCMHLFHLATAQSTSHPSLLQSYPLLTSTPPKMEIPPPTVFKKKFHEVVHEGWGMCYCCK